MPRYSSVQKPVGFGSGTEVADQKFAFNQKCIMFAVRYNVDHWETNNYNGDGWETPSEQGYVNIPFDCRQFTPFSVAGTDIVVIYDMPGYGDSDTSRFKDTYQIGCAWTFKSNVPDLTKITRLYLDDTNADLQTTDKTNGNIFKFEG